MPEDPFGALVPKDIDEFTLPNSGGGFSCETCGTSLTYSGRGRHPRFCADHKPGKKRSTTTGPAKRGRPRKGTPPAGLISTATLAWGGAGYVMQLKAQSAGQYAAGNMMQLQAPDAGQRIARVVDPYLSKFSWLRALAGTAGPIGDLGMLIAPPLITFVLAERPEAVEMIKPMLGMFIAPIAEEMLKAQRKQSETLHKMSQQDAEVAQATQDILDTIFPNARGSSSENGSGEGAEHGGVGDHPYDGRANAL